MSALLTLTSCVLSECCSSVSSNKLIEEQLNQLVFIGDYWKIFWQHYVKSAPSFPATSHELLKAETASRTALNFKLHPRCRDLFTNSLFLLHGCKTAAAFTAAFSSSRILPHRDGEHLTQPVGHVTLILCVIPTRAEFFQSGLLLSFNPRATLRSRYNALLAAAAHSCMAFLCVCVAIRVLDWSEKPQTSGGFHKRRRRRRNLRPAELGRCLGHNRSSGILFNPLFSGSHWGAASVAEKLRWDRMCPCQLEQQPLFCLLVWFLQQLLYAHAATQDRRCKTLPNR